MLQLRDRLCLSALAIMILAACSSAPTPTPADYINQPLVLQDGFFKPANDWNYIDIDNRFVSGQVRTQDGKYRWDLKCNEDFVWPSIALNNTLTTDFYAAVDAQLVSGPETTGYGLVFRYNDGDYYFFQVNPTGKFALKLYNSEKWEVLINWTATNALQLNTANRLAVGARGRHFDLFINDTYVGSAEDDRLKNGRVGLAVELFGAGTVGVFEFEDFQWRAPMSATTLVTPTPIP